MKIRPIVSNCNGPTTKLSWLLSRLLSPFLSSIPAHLKNSSELIETIRTRENTTSHYPCSYDVSAMYTSIPIEDAISATISMLQENNITNIKGLTLSQIKALLQIILNNTYFQFQDKFYKQNVGLPMGSSLSGILAIIFMNKLEINALTSMSNIPLFKRYVDDCFALCNNVEEAHQLFEALNSQHQRIKFEIELPNENNHTYTLSLLDFSVNINTNNSNETTFKFYRKTARKNIFVNYNSNLPTTSKINFIKNERLRILERCSRKKDNQQCQIDFDKTLRLNDYPCNIVERTKIHLQDKKKRKQNNQDQRIFIRLPFINDNIDKTIKRIFKQENMDVGLTRKNFTLRNYLNKHQHEKECNISNCSINDKKNMLSEEFCI